MQSACGGHRDSDSDNTSPLVVLVRQVASLRFSDPAAHPCTVLPQVLVEVEAAYDELGTVYGCMDMYGAERQAEEYGSSGTVTLRALVDADRWVAMCWPDVPMYDIRTEYYTLYLGSVRGGGLGGGEGGKGHAWSYGGRRQVRPWANHMLAG